MDRRKLALVACAIYIKKGVEEEKKTCIKARRFWNREIFRNRKEKGEFNHLLQELRLHKKIVFDIVNIV